MDASQSVAGIAADFLLTQTRNNIEAQLVLRASAGWRQLAKDLSAQQGKKECPSWGGKDPGKTLRGWLRMQLSGQRDPRSLSRQFSLFLTFFFFCFFKIIAPRRDACNHQHPRVLP